MVQHAYTRPAGGALQSGFVVPRQAPQRQQLLPGRHRTACIATFSAAAIMLYLAAFPPWINRSNSHSSHNSARHLKRTNAFKEPPSTQGLTSHEASSAVILPPISSVNGSKSDLGSSTGRLDPRKVVTSNPTAAALWNSTAFALKLHRGDVNEMCSLLLPPSAQTIAVVGNGPITDKDRAAIANSTTIIRFNQLNNRLANETLGMWAVRANYRTEAPYWGFWQLRKGGRAAPLVDAASGVMLLGGGPDQLEPLLQSYPGLSDKAYHVNIDKYSKLYRDLFSEGRIIEPYPPDPSTGLLVLLQVVACFEQGSGAHIDIYGFNWSPKHWETHMMQAEEYIVTQLLKPLDASVHPTACNGLRTCETGCDRPDYVLQHDGVGQHCLPY